MALVKILRDADVAFANCEMSFRRDEGYATYKGTDMNLTADPLLAEDLAWAGIDIVSRANNHTMDYGVEGMVATGKNLEKAGIAHAGAGMNLSQARAPAQFDSRSSRVALISCASTFPAWSAAADSKVGLPGRPGLNPLRVTRTYQIEQAFFDNLKKIREALYPERPTGAREEEEKEGVLRFLENRFVAGTTNEILATGRESDVAAIMQSVRAARGISRLVLVSIHAHESDRSRVIPSKFLPPFARACIDAGADAFIGHGPHLLRAIEIYKNRPIFYSLGNFFFQYETVWQVPHEVYEAHNLEEFNPSDVYDRMRFPKDTVYWETIIPFATFEGDKLAELKLYPVALNNGAVRYLRGFPELADPATGKRIIEGLAKLSEPYGTKIVYRDAIGIVQGL